MQLILWPAVITLTITLLRLVGELSGWPRSLFNPAAGGGGAPHRDLLAPHRPGSLGCLETLPAGQGSRERLEDARIPVAIVMLFAIFGSWGTHYDALPPNPTPELQSAGPLARWFYIGLLPQMTIWIANTVRVGTLLGALLVAVAKPTRRV